MTYRASETCFQLIRGEESCKLKEYRDFNGVRTIGWGHAIPEKAPPHPDITQAQADAMLRADVAWAESEVNYYADHITEQCQFDALVSFVFNIGVGRWRGDCTTRRKLQAEDLQGAADAMLLWRKYTPKGETKRRDSWTLTERRKKERNMFLGRPLDAPLDIPLP
jgi:lysozyme